MEFGLMAVRPRAQQRVSAVGAAVLVVAISLVAVVTFVALTPSTGVSLDQDGADSTHNVNSLLTKFQRAQEHVNKKFEIQISDLDQDVEHLQDKLKAPATTVDAPVQAVQAPAVQPPRPAHPSLENTKNPKQWESAEQNYHQKMIAMVNQMLGMHPTTLDLEGYEQKGNFVVHRVVDQEWYYLDIVGPPNTKISCSIEGSDNYKRKFHGYGEIYSGPLHRAQKGISEYIQCRNLVSGAVQYFRFTFKGAA
eukprot:CAMPEP_0114545978 /NCGR_PEP_ID=MMETSP0114-20121206/3696_1 /TAXON_ID=31324 /ORGANISM="Goniomonas sp, Strain m" /LENGTH=249 /DNA_ID=CAMNT_0001730457 /DNA_START=12 /DNA_END=761 /DNA_ORIENTATION=+